MSPGKRIFNACFDQLVNYVENDCANKELVFKPENYSWWEKFTYKYLPKKYSKDIRIVLGVNYINNIIALDTEEYVYLREIYRNVLDLYMWYISEYSYHPEANAMNYSGARYIDNDGNNTDNLFGDGKLNKLHPDYIEYVSMLSMAEEYRAKIIEERLQQLLKIRHVL